MMVRFPALARLPCALALLASVPLTSVQGMTFAGSTSDGITMVHGTGPIQSGDAERLMGEILLAPRGSRFLLRVDSGGGSVVAGESLASVIKRYAVVVVVGDTDVCASACFLLFAASPMKLAAETARIGVHSASASAGETMRSMAVTTAMARSASDLGVPAAIVGRMVTTAPGAMAWLSRSELASLGTQFLEPSAGNPPPQTAVPLLAAPPVATLPITPVPKPSGGVPKDEQAPSFLEGRASRTAWEQWFATLGGDSRLGAEFWTNERSKRRPAECAGPPEFLAGCIAAKQRLTGPDIRRKSDAQYWWGWNSL